MSPNVPGESVVTCIIRRCNVESFETPFRRCGPAQGAAPAVGIIRLVRCAPPPRPLRPIRLVRCIPSASSMGLIRPGLFPPPFAAGVHCRGRALCRPARPERAFERPMTRRMSDACHRMFRANPLLPVSSVGATLNLSKRRSGVAGRHKARPLPWGPSALCVAPLRINHAPHPPGAIPTHVAADTLRGYSHPCRGAPACMEARRGRGKRAPSRAAHNISMNLFCLVAFFPYLCS